MAAAKLKCPWPYFGGKSRVASLVWDRLGDPDNYIEPSCGSAAVLLGRPTPPKVETINDVDCYVSNFWRATQHDPEQVAEFADWPVNEADLHSRHKWLVLSDDAKAFRQKMRSDPHYYDCRIAGWWAWGLCCWIGGGWCTVLDAEVEKLPRLTNDISFVSAKGTAHEARRPVIAAPGSEHGRGVHGQLPQRRIALPARSHRDAEKGVQRKPPSTVNHQKRPRGEREGGNTMPGVNGRPQLADAFARGRGVHGNDDAGTCQQRREWLIDWFGRLRDRLRTVRVCCGDWRRVCDSESVTTRLGITGIFFDPPYSAEAGRHMALYASESGDVAHRVREYCLERGDNPLYRICLAGYEGEGHEELERHGWSVVAWKAQGGYGNRSTKGKANAERERLWFSPHCLSNDLPLLASVGLAD